MSTVWIRQQERVRAEVVAAARALFAKDGIEATSVEQIIEHAGISRRSFYRYFGSKEEVLLGDLQERGRHIARALQAQPPAEPPWSALRGALVASREQTMPDRSSDLALGRLMTTSPGLRAARHEKQRVWIELLVPVLAARMGDGSEYRAAAIVGAALTCLDVASEAWIASDGDLELADLFDEAVEAVHSD